jgi:maltose/moltooligosaccharide transporter
MQKQPELSFWQIWNMSFGFFGIQFGWGLQMANMSAIYQYLGADADKIPLLWLAAPVTGLIVQPIVGYYSDRTWNRWGRRRPYFLFGAIFASLALIAMPNSSTLWMAAGLLWILDASVNISMEPFRAFVGDMLPPRQRKFGFSMQSLLIGAGAVLSSALPWVLSNWFGIEGQSTAESRIPLTVHIAFYTGAILFMGAVLYTVLTTREYPPEDMQAFRAEQSKRGPLDAFKEIFAGIFQMPKVMRRLALSQFFAWFALFCMWINFAPAVAGTFYSSDTESALYQQGAEWAGVCFSAYNFMAFLFSFVLLGLVRYMTARTIHTVALLLGAAGLISVGILDDPRLLLVSMVGIGIAWASILAMPYAMLSNAIPSAKMGFYMGVFNFFIVLPQILASLGLGPLLKHVLQNDPMNAILFGGVSFILSALTLQLVDKAAADGA